MERRGKGRKKRKKLDWIKTLIPQSSSFVHLHLAVNYRIMAQWLLTKSNWKGKKILIV